MLNVFLQNENKKFYYYFSVLIYYSDSVFLVRNDVAKYLVNRRQLISVCLVIMFVLHLADWMLGVLVVSYTPTEGARLS